MKLRVECKADTLPVGNNMMVVSLFKESLKKTNIDYYNSLYLYDGRNNKKSKNFSFSMYIKDSIVENEVVLVKDKVIIFVTTSDMEFFINIYNGLTAMKFSNDFVYRGYKLDIVKISNIPQTIISKNSVVFKALSPICIKNKKGDFITPENEEYEQELYYIINQTLINARGYGLKQPLKFENILLKNVVSKEYIREFAEITNRPYLLVDASKGVFKLTGDVEDINYIYQVGVGFRRSQGYGMIEIVLQ